MIGKVLKTISGAGKSYVRGGKAAGKAIGKVIKDVRTGRMAASFGDGYNSGATHAIAGARLAKASKADIIGFHGANAAGIVGAGMLASANKKDKLNQSSGRY